MRQLTGFLLSCLASVIMVFGTAMQVQAVTVKGTDLVCNGESFFQASNICSELSKLARADGILAQGDNFKQIAVSGAPIANIVNFYKNCNPKPTYLVSDGAGIDLMQGNCSDVNCAKIQSCANTLKQYLEEMKKGGTKKLLWMIYPDPQGGSWANLKKNQDLWAKVVPEIMAKIEVPKVLLVDLRPVWSGHYSQYTSDGIHCTAAGGTATAQAFWKAMKDSNFFDITPVDVPYTIAKNAPSAALLNHIVGNGRISLSLSLDQPSSVMLQLTTVSGRNVLSAQRQAPVSGVQTMEFPLGAIAPGMYLCEVRSGRMAAQSTLLVP